MALKRRLSRYAVAVIIGFVMLIGCSGNATNTNENVEDTADIEVSGVQPSLSPPAEVYVNPQQSTESVIAPTVESTVENETIQPTEAVSEICLSDIRSTLKSGDYSQLIAGANLQGCDFSGLDLNHLDLRNANLAYTNFFRANLENTDLSGANLQHAVFWQSDFGTGDSETKFEGADVNSALLPFGLGEAFGTENNIFSAKNLEEAFLVISPGWGGDASPAALILTGETIDNCYFPYPKPEVPCHNVDGTATATIYYDYSDYEVCIVDTEMNSEYCYSSDLIQKRMKWNPAGDVLLIPGVKNESEQPFLVVANQVTHAFQEYPWPYLPDGSSGNAIDWSPDGTKFALAYDGLVYIYDYPGMAEVTSFPHRTEAYSSMEWDSTGTRIATKGDSFFGECRVYIWDVLTGQLVHTIEPPEDACLYDMAWSPGGELLVVTMEDDGIQFFDATTFEHLKTIGTPQEIVNEYGEFGFGTVTFAKDGRFIRIENSQRAELYIIPWVLFPTLNR